MLHDQELTALVSSRICHDLISPIGAISNGVELLTVGGAKVTPEIGLIGESVTSAAHKLRCFRIAFGAADADARLPMTELVAATDAMFTGRASVVYMGETGGDIARLLAKTLLLTLLCQERCLPLGGRSEVKLAEDGFSIITAAPRLKDIEDLWELTKPNAKARKVIPAEVQFPLLGQLLHLKGLHLTRQIEENVIRLGVSGLKP